jgi:hypothetical protein
MKNFIIFLFLTISVQAFSDSYKNWGKNLYITENVYDSNNRYIKLNDGTFWLLNYTYESFWDRFKGKDVQSTWLAPQQVEISYSQNHKYPYVMINLDTHEKVEARQINPNLLLYTALDRLGDDLSTSMSQVSNAIRSNNSMR